MIRMDSSKTNWKYYAMATTHLVIALVILWPFVNPSAAKKLSAIKKEVNVAKDTLSATETFTKDSLIYKKSDASLFSGLLLEYYFNNPKEIWNKQGYLKGIKNGIYVVFTQKGDTIEYGNYKAGQKDGKFVYFSDNRQIHHMENYRNGVMVK
jgi:antitoxin component YwqK of YwqJK toxin-antitoxin module